MDYFRLTSSRTGADFLIREHFLEGYSVDFINKSLTLYTEHYPISLQNTVGNQWDNWDEFVDQVKARFEKTYDDF